MGKECAQCGQWCEKHEFSSNQWRKGIYAKCLDCVEGNRTPSVRCDECGRTFLNRNNLEQHQQTHQRRDCAQCGRNRHCDYFSSNQWTNKGDDARCIDCCQMLYECDICQRQFQGKAQFESHRRTHRPKDVPCPGCGKLHRSVTDTTLHFETGYCSSCPGREAARRTVHRLVQASPGGQRFLVGAPQLTYGDQSAGGWQADGNNYKCPSCQRRFKSLGALMSHQEARAQCRGVGQAPVIGVAGGGGGGGYHSDYSDY